MHDLATTILLSLLTLLAGGASIPALRALFRPATPTAPGSSPIHRATLLLTLGCAGVFLYRWLIVTQQWMPVEAHVDGLVLMSTLLAGLTLWGLLRGRLPGIAGFTLPAITVLLTWAVCASAWTFHPFAIESVWKAVHLLAVYLGALACLATAAAGGMYLLASVRLRRKRDPLQGSRLGSLETLERLMARAAATGFALLSLGVVTGLIIAGAARLEPGWWHTPKIILALGVWLLCALVMNVRMSPRLRGIRAAILSLASVVLLLATMIFATLAGEAKPSTSPAPPAPTSPPAQEAR